MSAKHYNYQWKTFCDEREASQLFYWLWAHSASPGGYSSSAGNVPLLTTTGHHSIKNTD